MTQRGTSVVIKQTNDGLGSVERRLEMLQVVARDQMNQPLSIFILFSVCQAGAYPSMY